MGWLELLEQASWVAQIAGVVGQAVGWTLTRSAAGNADAEDASLRRVVAWRRWPPTSQKAQPDVSQDELAKLANDLGSTLLDDATASDRLIGASDPDTLRSLIALLHDDNTDVRWAASEALEGTSDPTALQSLATLLDDDVRHAAAEALAKVQQPEVCRHIVDLISAASDFSVGQSALEVLRAVADGAWRHAASGQKALREQLSETIRRLRDEE